MRRMVDPRRQVDGGWTAEVPGMAEATAHAATPAEAGEEATANTEALRLRREAKVTRDADGRWSAVIPDTPCARARGATPEEAIDKVVALAPAIRRPRFDVTAVRRTAGYLRKRNLGAEIAGERQTYSLVLGGHSGRGQPIPPGIAEAISFFMEQHVPRRRGRPKLTWYQRSNTGLRWWAIGHRVRRWQRVYRERFGYPDPKERALAKVADETGIAVETLRKHC